MLIDVKKIQEKINNRKVGQAESLPTSEVKLVQFAKKYEQELTHINDLQGKLPNVGEIYFIYTANAFSAFAFIPYIIQLKGAIELLTVSTFNMSEDVANALLSFLKSKKIIELNVVINNKFRESERDRAKFVDLEKEKNCNFRFKQSHAKLICAQVGNDYYVIEGSGNSSKNSEIEQYIFYNDYELFLFRNNFLCI